MVMFRWLLELPCADSSMMDFEPFLRACCRNVMHHLLPASSAADEHRHLSKCCIGLKSSSARIIEMLTSTPLQKAFKWLHRTIARWSRFRLSHGLHMPCYHHRFPSVRESKCMSRELLPGGRRFAMAGSGQHAASKPQLQASGAKRRRTENSAAAGNGSTRLREKASACAVAKLKAARQVLTFQVLGSLSIWVCKLNSGDLVPSELELIAACPGNLTCSGHNNMASSQGRCADPGQGI